MQISFLPLNIYQRGNPFLSHFLKRIRFSFFQQMTTLQGEAEDLTSASCCPKLIFQAMHIKKIRSEGTAIFFETG